MTLTTRHALVLAWLDAHPDASAADIAAGLGDDVDAVVQLCAELTLEGMIELVPTGGPELSRDGLAGACTPRTRHGENAETARKRA